MIRRRQTAGMLLLPATLIVVVLLVLPLVLLFRYSLNRFVPGEFMVEALTLENYTKFWTDPFYFAVLRTTVAMAAGVTVLCLALAFPVGLFLARTTSRHKSLMLMAVVLPLFVGNAVRAAGWMVAFGHKGIVNWLLDAVLPGASVDIMYTPTAVVIGILSVNLPYAVLTLQSVLEGIDRASEEAAISLGATPFAAWRLVTLPLATPGVLAAGVLCFILAMNAYATPILLGGPRFQMMAPLVADQVLQQANWPFGAAVSFVLIAATLVLTAAANLSLGRRAA